jgi:MOSC domain-containing protein YiiM
MELRLLSVNVGMPKQIGMRDGAPLMSAIGKTRVASPTIEVGALGLTGDAVANPKVHGGVDKAVYAYPADNWAWWEMEKNFPCFPAAFGENLTLRGADETEVHIGDRFAWGEAVLEISQPRSPCHKFQVYSKREHAGALMTISGRCGWYMRVVREGIAATDAPLTRISEGPGPDLRTVFFAAFGNRVEKDLKAEIAANPMLAEAWRVKVQ